MGKGLLTAFSQAETPPADSPSRLPARHPARSHSSPSPSQADVINTDISSLTPEERSTLDNWVSFYRQRYQQVGVLRQ